MMYSVAVTLSARNHEILRDVVDDESMDAINASNENNPTHHLT